MDEQLIRLFNRVSSNFSASLTVYNNNMEYDKLEECLKVFQEFLHVYKMMTMNEIETNYDLEKLMFVDLDRDISLLKMSKNKRKHPSDF